MSKTRLTEAGRPLRWVLVAQMAELVDAPASGAGARKGVEVRVLFWAPFPSLRTTTKVQKHPKKPAQAGFFVSGAWSGHLTLCTQACRTLSYSGDMLPSISSKSVKRFGRHALVVSTYIWQSMQFSPSERTAFFELLKWR